MRLCLFANPEALHTRRLAVGLAAMRFDVHIVYRGPGDVPGATYESFAIPHFGLRYPYQWPRRKQRYLAHFLRDFDVVGVHFLQDWGFSPELLEHGCFTASVWGSDVCPPPDGPQPSPASVETRRQMLRAARAVTTFSKATRRQVAEYADLDPARIEVVPLGVNLELFQPPAEPPSGPPIIGYSKGFGHAYGPQHLVRAMPSIVRRFPEVTFEMIGRGPLLDECQTLASSLEVAERITWLPTQPHAALPAIMSRWAVAVVPSVCESLGVGALEASALQVPVVASAVGGLPEAVLDGQTGLLVPPGDSSALANAVATLLADPHRRITLGYAGRRFVAEHYDWKDCLDKWASFYEKAAAVLV